MVLYVTKWDIHPDKVEAYLGWTESAIRRLLAVPGVVEFQVYRGIALPSGGQVVVTYEFADLAAWAAWHAHEDVQKVIDELYMLALNVSAELWGSSPTTPVPIRPGK